MGKSINVLFVASECVPLCKTGGLADVVGALPSALSKNHVRSSVILPLYGTLDPVLKERMELVQTFEVPIGWHHQYVGLKKAVLRNRTYYFVDNESYFARDTLYGYYDDTERYIFFALAVLEALKYMEHFDVLHCNDWQAALVPVLLKHFYREQAEYTHLRTVLTIHNLRFQGYINRADFEGMLRLSGQEPWLNEMTMHEDQTNLLKGGMYSADAVTTVSPTYAREIRYAYFGEHLEHSINDIAYKLHGIINGIDQKAFNPAKDPTIYHSFDDLAGKRLNQAAFREEFDLPDDGSMIVGMVTRLDKQKGLDLVLYAMDEMMKLPVQFVLLGTGDGMYEQAFRVIEEMHPDRVRSFIMYSEALAHKVYAAADAFLMPSQFEPCGLGQMIAMRYGALPIVRETGGLKDTVIPYNKYTGEGTGFSFANYNGDELVHTLRKASRVYHQKPDQYESMVQQAMNMNFDWSQSAKTYKKLYQSVLTTE